MTSIVSKEPDEEWAIKGVLPLRGVVSLIGAKHSFKSFVGLDLALSIAEGRSWGGRAVRKGVVAFISAEGQQRKRLEPHEASSNFYGLQAAPDLGSGADLEDLIAALADLPEPPAVVFIDTVAATLAGKDENGQACGVS